MSMCPQHDIMMSKVSQTHEAIYGNGQPETGLLWSITKQKYLIKGNFYMSLLLLALIGYDNFSPVVMQLLQHLLKL